jgi:hypothetical protein
MFRMKVLSHATRCICLKVEFVEYVPNTCVVCMALGDLTEYEAKRVMALKT